MLPIQFREMQFLLVLSLAAFVFSVFIPLEGKTESTIGKPLSRQFTSRSKSLTVGILLPSSGQSKGVADAMRRGTDLARREHAGLFEDIRFAFAELGESAEEAMESYQELRRKKGASLVYAVGEFAAKTIAPAAESDGVPFIIDTFEQGGEPDKHYVIHSYVEVSQVAETLNSYFLEKGYRKLGIVQNDRPETNRLIASLKKQLHPTQNLEMVAVADRDEEDFRSIIIQTRTAGVDALGVFLSASQLPHFYRQLREFRYFIPTFGNDVFGNKLVVEQAGGLMDGAVFPQIGLSEKFRKRFSKTFGSESQVLVAAKAYDFAVLTGSVVRAISRNPSAEDILGALALHPNQIGVVGPYSYVEREDSGKAYLFPVVMKVVRGNKIKQLNGKF